MLERFINYIQAEKRYSPLTVKNYRRDVERFIRWCEAEAEPSMRITPFKVEEVEAIHIREWIYARTQHGKGRGKGEKRLGAASLNRELSSLKSFFRFLIRTQAIKRDPMQGIHTLKTPKRLPSFVPESRMRHLLEEEQERKEAPEGSAKSDFLLLRDQLIILIFYGCGIRLAELVRIDTDHFENDFHSLRVVGKGDKERVIPLVEPLREAILHYISQIERQNICKNREKALFLTLKGARISRITVYRIVKRTLREGGVQGKRSPHVLRHTFATHLLNHGADMREIQELMGHASLQATQVYTHNSITQLQKIYLEAHPREGHKPKR
ncbi:MAG: integrase [Rikenellaceae bacterium]|nr:integrase [Rikenellaceae bacterium]